MPAEETARFAGFLFLCSISLFLMPKTKAKSQRHLPRRGFASAPIQTPRVIAQEMSKSVRDLGTNTAATVDTLRALWDKDYPYRTCPAFTEEDMYKYADKELVVQKNIEMRNPNHTVQELVFVAQCKEWTLKVMRQNDGHLDWDLCVFNGQVSCFHPDEARNQILAYHSQEVYDRWRKHVRASFEVAAPVLLAACKEALPTLRAWSATCCDSSERLMKSLDGVVVINRVAYLIW